MSLYDYQMSQKASAQNYPFYALVMAAIRQADSDNLAALKFAFPDIYIEFELRYNAPGGCLTQDELDSLAQYTKEQYELEDTFS